MARPREAGRGLGPAGAVGTGRTQSGEGTARGTSLTGKGLPGPGSPPQDSAAPSQGTGTVPSQGFSSLRKWVASGEPRPSVSRSPFPSRGDEGPLSRHRV